MSGFIETPAMRTSRYLHCLCVSATMRQIRHSPRKCRAHGARLLRHGIRLPPAHAGMARMRASTLHGKGRRLTLRCASVVAILFGKRLSIQPMPPRRRSALASTRPRRSCRIDAERAVWTSFPVPSQPHGRGMPHRKRWALSISRRCSGIMYCLAGARQRRAWPAARRRPDMRTVAEVGSAQSLILHWWIVVGERAKSIHIFALKHAAATNHPPNADPAKKSTELLASVTIFAHP
mmetsp:Transcript_36807/g.106156  ORF Transcript_36807/g.106156 Transcript_36807/m.106156 type:complete len:235 (+) Transcript_36807:1648-2352(+)